MVPEGMRLLLGCHLAEKSYLHLDNDSRNLPQSTQICRKLFANKYENFNFFLAENWADFLHKFG